MYLNMKYGNALFVEYTKAINQNKPGTNDKKLKKEFPQRISELKNKVIHGPPGIGKYSTVLNNICKYSPSNLKYERKINIESGKKNFLIKLSDIHFEVDMELLGCNAKLIWDTIYKHILDIIATKPTLTGIIVCKNFHAIHGELLDNFYSYMQSIFYKNIKVIYILITENVCFIPYNILYNVDIITCSRPTKSEYSRYLKHKIDIKLEDINNIKNIEFNKRTIQYNKKKCDEIIKMFDSPLTDTFLSTLREALYELLIYNLNIEECIWYILNHYVREKKISKMENVMKKLGDFLKFYNNNYRPIYHLEVFFLYLYSSINEL